MIPTKPLISLTIAASLFASLLSASHHETADGVTVVPLAEVDWEQLNPARGDQSPAAGTLWGDRKGEVATGFLARFVDGFSSPPHIHNVTYRAVVIRGLIHNDDPDAQKMWMPPGSFWTQPKGELHITAVKGPTNIAYVEIDSGPYLVMPPEEAYDSGERPVNVDPANIVWLDAADASWVADVDGPRRPGGPEIAYLWGAPSQGELNGTFLRLPAGFGGRIATPDAAFRAIVVTGEIAHRKSATSPTQTLVAGSFFGSDQKTHHHVTAPNAETTTLYIRSTGKYEVVTQP